MMLKKLRVLVTEIRRLKRKTSEQSSRNTRVIYGEGVEGCSTSPWRQTEDQQVNREVWDWCQLLGRGPQHRSSVTYLNVVLRWSVPFIFSTNTSQPGGFMWRRVMH